MRRCSASLLFSLLAFYCSTSVAQQVKFSQAKCTVIYSLKRSADQYFNDEVQLLSAKIIKQNIQLIDLNHWRNTPPHIEISGRARNSIRQEYNLSNNTNQAILVNSKGLVIKRYTGSVTLVNALMACH